MARTKFSVTVGDGQRVSLTDPDKQKKAYQYLQGGGKFKDRTHLHSIVNGLVVMPQATATV